MRIDRAGHWLISFGRQNNIQNSFLSFQMQTILKQVSNEGFESKKNMQTNFSSILSASQNSENYRAGRSKNRSFVLKDIKTKKAGVIQKTKL